MLAQFWMISLQISRDAKYFSFLIQVYSHRGLVVVIIYYFQIGNKKELIISSSIVINNHNGPMYIETPFMINIV